MSENEGSEKYGDVENKSPIISKPYNFWYHYKWHTFAALFVIIVVVICTLQMCRKESYDIYVMYAGSEAISRSSAN